MCSNGDEIDARRDVRDVLDVCFQSLKKETTIVHCTTVSVTVNQRRPNLLKYIHLLIHVYIKVYKSQTIIRVYIYRRSPKFSSFYTDFSSLQIFLKIRKFINL